jgi:hypothetical protein
MLMDFYGSALSLVLTVTMDILAEYSVKIIVIALHCWITVSFLFMNFRMKRCG